MQHQLPEKLVQLLSPNAKVEKFLWPAESSSNLTEVDLVLWRVTDGSPVQYFITKMSAQSSNELRGRTCDYCPKFCYTEADAVRHESTHQKNKNVFCSICKAGFVRQSYLTEHQLIHDGVRFYCPKCPTFFSLKSNLNRHLRLHDGRKPYTCDICKTSFKLKTTLQDHVRTHTGEKPYSCTLCDKKYSRASSLRRHYSTMHLKIKQSYECYHCQKKFVWRADLGRHVKIHLRDDAQPPISEMPLPEGLELGERGSETEVTETENSPESEYEISLQDPSTLEW